MAAMNDYILCLSGIKAPRDGIRPDFPISILVPVMSGLLVSVRSVTLLWQSCDVFEVFDRVVSECRHE